MSMSHIQHHIPEPLLVAYVSGNLPEPFALVVAAHISLCVECRAAMEAHQQVGGVILNEEKCVAVSAGMKDALLDLLDVPVPEEKPSRPKGPYPAPVADLFETETPDWRSLGRGVKQSILMDKGAGSVRLLSIPSGMAMPDHSHGGMEMTLVLQGSFSDVQGRFARGDVEIADSSVTHTPIADEGDTCICLAATDASLKFNALLPRLLQPLFRI